jgi:PTH2 family peptidyl-tRNA hydrolase
MQEAKQVLVVRKDLHMRKGKIAAQCAHATMMVLLNAARWNSSLDLSFDPTGGYERFTFVYKGNSAWGLWLRGGFAKIVVGVNSEAGLLEVYKDAKRVGLPRALVVDEGRTEFGGVPTRTVVAVGPGWNHEIDKITGGLPLI